MVPLAVPGQVTVPLAEYQALEPPEAAAPDPEAQVVARAVIGRLDRGVFVGTVTTTFEVTGGPVQVQVAPAAATLVRGSVDGKPATFAVDGDWETIGLPIGHHAVDLGLVQGRDTDRFARELALSLPPGPPTSFRIRIPETPIDATLTGGVLTAERIEAGATVLEGWLDAKGALNLGWERRPEHTVIPGDASVETRVDAVVQVDRDVIVGTARYAVDVRSGAIDQIALHIPAGVEILDVSGPAVLQWQTAADGGLQILLRRVVEDRVDAVVKYQYPAESTGSIVFPTPTGPMSGVVGIEAPVALELAVASVDKGRVLDPRDVPPSVLELTPDPLSVVVAFDEVPAIAITSTPRPPVGSSTTQIDDLQGITVLGDDGSEVGKIRLTVRNTSKQVLVIDLPDGAHLTHCFRDGLPLRPAADPARAERTIVPLLRSERSAATEHVVAGGETLSGIALTMTGSSDKWTTIASANPMVDPAHLMVGQKLVVPADSGNEERSFVLELGWERQTPALGSIGYRTVALPTVDLPVMSANWHVYLPDEVEPLHLSTTMDPVNQTSLPARLLGSLVMTMSPGAAWAGEPEYTNSLLTRRSKWEAKQEQEVLGTDPFPLVGRRLAFSGKLLGTEPPQLAVTYVAGMVASGLRVGVSAVAAAAVAAAAARPRDWRVWVAVVAAVGAGLWLGIPLLGTWRHLLLGVDLGLVIGLGLRRAPGALLVEVGAVAAVLLASCGGVSSAASAALLLPMLAFAHWRVR